jgi:hypothetical protein
LTIDARARNNRPNVTGNNAGATRASGTGRTSRLRTRASIRTIISEFKNKREGMLQEKLQAMSDVTCPAVQLTGATFVVWQNEPTGHSVHTEAPPSE